VSSSKILTHFRASAKYFVPYLGQEMLPWESERFDFPFPADFKTRWGING
jgi:hypothetical protein